jgi:beta-glucosidase
MKHPFIPLLLALASTRLIAAEPAPTAGQPGPAPIAAPTATAISDAEVARRVDALLARMTLEEKIGQLTQIGPWESGPDRKPEDLIRKGMISSILWSLDSAQINKLQQLAVKETRLGIPMLFGFDIIHGYKTVFPVPLGMAASWDPALVEQGAGIAASEAAAAGINWTFGPMVDIARDARWGRMVEGAGEDAYLGEAMARAQVLGFQGPKLGTPNRVLGSVKHFAGYGASEGGRDYDSCYIPEVTLHNVYLRPFKAAIDAGVGTVMAAYMCLNDVPASGNQWLMQDILRKELGFRGFVVSDSSTISCLSVHGFTRNDADASIKGLKAGVDMDMGSQTYSKNVAALVESGKLPIAVVDNSVRNVLAVKIRMGLFENPYADFANRDKVFNDPTHRAAARTAAQRSLVLLRNENSALPLAKTLRSIAVIGPLGDATEDIKGSWTAEWDAAVSVHQGLRNKLPQAKIDFVRGGDMQRIFTTGSDAREGKKVTELMSAAEMKLEVAKAVEAAKAAETVVLVLGERRNMSGEDASSSSMGLDGNQQELLEAVVATGKPVVLVLMNGRPLNITWASEHVPAILEAWFPGSEGGNAIADALVGDINPGGKLPVTWPRSVGQCPIYYNHNITQAPEQDKLFTSRYANDTSLPLYPFGHGLSYTSFAYSNLTLDKQSMKSTDSLSVSVEITNTGKVAGDEVVQLYVHQRAGSAARPVRELKGFQRVTLAPGEKRTLHFSLGKAELEFWSPLTRSWVVEPEGFDVWVGGDSRAVLHSDFRIEE